ncbi:MAG: phosphoribosylglycinamide formyltransferase [Muribaculaceae bacterium]|nr:phosphoribosylglycinamide formyltransferase [Muribaculaceae bacterium]
MKKIAILCSGNGTNAEHIYDYFAHGNRVKVELVIYDRPDAPVAERMRARDVDTLFLPPEVWTDRPDEIVTLLMQRGIDLVVLAGFLRHVPETITRAFTGRMLNIHPSLLPAYSGKGMYGRRVHEAVIAAGDTRTGATVHYVTDRLDAGEILMQEEVEVSPDDTAESLEQKVHQVEYSLYPRAIMAALGRLDNITAAPQPAGQFPAPPAPPAPPASPAEPGQAPGQQAQAESPSAQPRESLTPGEEWADTLGVAYDPTKLPPEYPGAVPPPIPGGHAKEAPSHQASHPVPAGAAASGPQPDAPMPPAYLVWAVIMTVLCCLPAGVVAIIYSTQVSSKYYAGDMEGARRCSERAQIWIIVSFVIGVLVQSLYLPVALLFN